MNKELSFFKAMSKMELANAAGVSISTFRRWTVQHKSQLMELGVSPFAKVLNPAAVRYLCEFYQIDISEFREKWRNK